MMMSLLARYTAMAIAVLATAGTLTAQGGQLHLRGAPIDTFMDVPASADVIGREQAGNGFRHRAPTLARGTLGPRLIDTEALRERRLQLYAGRVTPPTAVAIEARAIPRAAPARAEAESATDAGQASAPPAFGLLIAGGLALMGLLLALVVASRRAPAAD